MTAAKGGSKQKAKSRPADASSNAERAANRRNNAIAAMAGADDATPIDAADEQRQIQLATHASQRAFAEQQRCEAAQVAKPAHGNDGDGSIATDIDPTAAAARKRSMEATHQQSKLDESTFMEARNKVVRSDFVPKLAPVSADIVVAAEAADERGGTDEGRTGT